MKQSKSGFTLIELIFVIVIIGLLAAVAVPRFLSTEQNAKIKPMVEVTKQIQNRVEERYQNIQDPFIDHAVKSDTHIMNYLSALTSKIDKHFQWDSNETDFEIAFNPDKKVPGNYLKDGSTKITIADDNKGQEPEGDGAAVCVKLIRWARQIPVTVDANVTQYDYNVSDVNFACISATSN